MSKGKLFDAFLKLYLEKNVTGSLSGSNVETIDRNDSLIKGNLEFLSNGLSLTSELFGKFAFIEENTFFEVALFSSL